MKQGQSVITLVMVLIAGALAIYFGYYVFDTLNDPFTTTLAYSYTVNDSVEADGLLAICIQHEMDHLVGKLFIDYLSPLKQQRIRQKVEKLDRLRSRA